MISRRANNLAEGEGEKLSVQAKQLISIDEYLAMERESEEKHEYLNGEIFAIGGASPNHGLIVANVVAHQIIPMLCSSDTWLWRRCSRRCMPTDFTSTRHRFTT